MDINNTARRFVVYALALGLLLTVAGAADARNEVQERPDLDSSFPVVPVGQQSAEGFGFATYEAGGCPPLSDSVQIAGSGSGGTWTFSYSVESACDGWTWTDTVTGAWDPAVGGCFTLQFFYQLCLENPAGVPGVAAVYDYSNSWDFNAGYVVLTFS